ncbi:MAG: hypothetical protein PVJ60_04270 [Phycisphaerales bacterium]
MRLLRILPEVILLPFLIRTIGETGYGVFVLAWSLILTIEALQLDLCSGVIKYGAAHLAQDRITEVNKVLSTAFIVSAIFGGISCICICILAGFFGSNMVDLAFSLTMIALMVLIMLPTIPYIGIMLARQRYDVNAALDTAFAYIRVLLIILWFSLAGPSLKALMVISVMTRTLGRLVHVPIAHLIVPGLRNRISLFDLRNCRALILFGGVITLCTLFLAVRSTGMKWIMGALVSTAFVAHMAIIYIPIELLSRIVLGMTLTVMPTASKHKAIENETVLQELLMRGTRYTTILCCGSFILAFFLLKPVIILWLGNEYVHLARYMLVLFGAAAFQMTSSCAHHMLRGMGCLRIAFVNSFIGQALLPVGITLLFLFWLGNPYWAFTWGMALGYVTYGIMQLVSCSCVLRMNFRRFFFSAYAEALLVSGISFTVLYTLVEVFRTNKLIHLIPLTLTGLVITSGCFYVLFSTQKEKILAKEMISKLMEISKKVQLHRD